MSKFLVTGGAGFIGSHIVEHLANEGHEVVVLDDFSNGHRRNLEFASAVGKRVQVIEGDVRDPKMCEAACRGVEFVFHEAALGSVPRSVEDPVSTHDVNVTGTLRVLEAARKAGVRRLVNAASSSAYGDTPELPKREHMPANPFSPYAASKLGQEQYCRAFSVSYGFETVSLRYFNVYGPRQDPSSQYAAVVPKFFAAFLKGEPPTIYGDGEQTRDFTFVEDVVRANLLAAQKAGAAGEIYNVAGGKAVTINQLAERVRKLSGASIAARHVEARPGDIRHSLADVSAARKGLGWEPTTSLEAGLARCLEWYKKGL